MNNKVNNKNNINSCAIVILGVTGDLAKRKLIPALFSIIANKKIDNFVFVGAAIENSSMAEVLENSKQFIEKFDQQIWDKILKNSYYQKLDFNSLQDFELLNSYLTELEQKHNLPGNRLFYLASMPDFFCIITKNCAASGLVKRTASTDTIWHRIIYEKPFGRDFVSANEINKCIANSFEEDQIYRVDHYLTKEVVSNIAMVRFANCVFEPLWSNKYIDQIHILLEEKLCIEGRGKYYDKYGAVRDVVQNHMLELLSLVAMEPPSMLTGDDIRDVRAAVLKDVEVVDGILGQYEDYKKEPHIDPNSQTETYASLLLHVNNPRWAGVPFYLKTGKCLGAKKTEIQIKFKKTDCLLLKGCPMESNYLTIGIYPRGTFYVSLNAKKPGTFMDVVPVQMEFCHSCLFKEISPESYEVIIYETINGEKSISVRFDEIECLWKVTDKLYAKNFPLYFYQRYSNGPQEARLFEQKHNIKLKN